MGPHSPCVTGHAAVGAWHYCLIIVYVSLNCPCLGKCRKGLNDISCVQHEALWLWLYVCSGLDSEHVNFGSDRNEEFGPLWFVGLLLPILNAHSIKLSAIYIKTKWTTGEKSVNKFVVSCVLIIDCWRGCRRVCSHLAAYHLVAYDMEEKTYKCHVNRMFVWIPVSSRWHYGYDTVLMHGGIQGDIVYMCDKFGVQFVWKLYGEVIGTWCFMAKHENGWHHDTHYVCRRLLITFHVQVLRMKLSELEVCGVQSVGGVC